jgi:mRNA interferase ChpB
VASRQGSRPPERGDVYLVDLDPIAGHEQSGHRPVLIITQRLFNTCGTPIVCPITNGGAYARNRGFAVEFNASKTTGVILCHQLRALDITARNGRYVETLSPEIIDDVLARVMAVLE